MNLIRGRQVATRSIAVSILSMLAIVPNMFAQEIQRDGSMVGVPVTGARGIRESVAQIMTREAFTPPRATPRVEPRLVVDRRNLPDNPSAPSVSRWPPASDFAALSLQPAPLAAQTVGVSWTGATLVDENAVPPDTMGAAGPSQFIVAVNGRIRSFTKAGIADGVLNATMDVFFNSVMTPPVANNFTSDPHIRYDRLSGRWFLTIIDVPGQTGNQLNRILLAVSDSGVITGSTVWTFFFFQGDTTFFADYDTLGIDNNALYMGANMFTLATGTFAGTNAYVIKKSSVLGAGPIVVTKFANLTGTTSGAGPFTPQGVDNFDPAATEGYIIGVDNAVFSQLDVRRVTNPGGTPTLSGNLAITVPLTRFPILVPHLGNTGGSPGNLDAVDDRLFAAQIRGGHLWTAHNIQVNSSGVASSSGGRNGTRWYELQNLSTTPTLVQSGTVFDNAATSPLSYWIPSIAVSGQGHAALGFSVAGALAHINAATIGRLSTSALTTMDGPVSVITSTGAAYNPSFDPGGGAGRRWGDYSFTSVDPNDDMTLWTIQEFCDATNSYGVRVTRLIAPPPATPDCAVPVLVNTSPQNVTITGTSSSGSGFFDPGASFANRLQATVNGGVTVNSVTFDSPTSVTLNVSTTTAGLKNVTLTNPDGQSVVGTNCISVVLPSADLSITNTDGQTAVVPGAPITYTIVASNSAGPNAVTGATVADTVPAEINTPTWTCAGTGGGTCPASGAGNINSSVDLPVGATVTFTLSGTVNAAAIGSLSNTATITPPGGTSDSNLANNSATDNDGVTPSSNVAITTTTAVSGPSVTYTIIATNAGPHAAIAATVTDTLPAAITGGFWTCGVTSGGACTPVGTGNINDSVNLPVGATVTYTVLGTVASSATNTTISNTASITVPAGSTDPDGTNNSATASFPAGTRFYAINPCRVLDTRLAGEAALLPNSVRNMFVEAKCGLPAGITAVAANVVAVTPAASGYVTVYPGPTFSPRPLATTIFYTVGRTLANNATITVGTDGTVNIFNSGSAPLNLAIDLNGYFK